MNDFELLKKRIKDFENTQRYYSDTGAFDTEPCYLFHIKLHDIFTNEVYTDSTVEEWDLYKPNYKHEKIKVSFAVNKMNAIIRDIFLIMGRINDREKLRLYLKDFAWRVSWETEELDKEEQAIEVLENRVEELTCYMRTLDSYANITKQCPNCKKYMMLEGYVCFGCGYDDSDNEGE